MRLRLSLLGESLLDLGVNSGNSLLVGELELSEPLLVLGVLKDSLTVLLGDDLSDNGVLSGNLNSNWVLSDVLVDLLVESFGVLYLCLLEVLQPAAELLLELVLVGLGEVVNVGLNVETEDVFSVLLSVVSSRSLCLLDDLPSLSSGDLSLLDSVSWESLGVVGNVDTTVNSSLKGTEDSVS